MNTSNFFENQLLATKFFVPTPSGTLISRPRLMALLHQSLERPLTLVSAPAGFGKTTLLATWAQSLPAGDPHVAWVTLDEEENEPWLFWTYVLTAFDRQQPGCLTSVLTLLQSPPVPSLKDILTTLINVLAETPGQLLLILDDYQVITESQVHTTLSYLVEHLPEHLHIILSTRVDPPFSLPLLRARKLMPEVRADQLRCTAEETGAFFDQVMGIQFPEATIQEVTARMEGWLVGLQLLGLSLPERLNPLTLLREISGDQRYILDYLTEEVLHRQPPEVQTFLLSTCILERLNASLCDAVRQQDGSQQLLEQLEHANLFVTPLDSKRRWYRYHALFAQALRHQLEQVHGDLVPILSHRASIWYAEHNYPTEAIVHAFSAKEWQWAADLIEGLPLISCGWGISERELMILRPWLEQLPVEVLHARPRLCLVSVQLFWTVAPHPVLEVWINAAEAILTASLLRNAQEDAAHPIRVPQTRQQQQDLLAEIIVFRANLRSYREDGRAALEYCQQALDLLSERSVVHAHIACVQLWALYASSANNAGAAIDCGLQGSLLAQKIGQGAVALGMMGTTAGYMIGTGHLHEAQRLSQQAMLLGRQAGGLAVPEMGWPAFMLAETLREWNHLDAARALAEEALSQSKESRSTCSSTHQLVGYEVLLRIHLSCGELDAARRAFQQVESIGMSMNRYLYLHLRSLFTTTDQVRLWLVCGELDKAVRWAEALDVAEQDGTPLERERQEVARVRIFLATKQPALALQRLEPVQERATTGKRWGHLIEIRLLQALAYEGLQEETRALNALSEALQMAEPEGYIRCFLDEGAPMEVLLYRLRRKHLQHGPTPYLDTVLAAFQHEHKERPKMQALPDPLSEREREVLQLLACGVSNQEIAEELVIAIDTVKRHVSHIFSKLGVHNRLQAERQARELGLLSEEH